MFYVQQVHNNRIMNSNFDGGGGGGDGEPNAMSWVLVCAIPAGCGGPFARLAGADPGHRPRRPEHPDASPNTGDRLQCGDSVDA